jgi:hypothetical protein
MSRLASKSATGGPLICARRIELAPPCGTGLATAPGSVVAQEPARFIETDLQAVAPEPLVLDAIGVPAPLSCSTNPPSTEPRFVTRRRRLSGMRLTDRSDSSSCQVSSYPDVAVSLRIRGQIYDRRARSQCPSNRNDSQIRPRSDSHFWANDRQVWVRTRCPKTFAVSRCLRRKDKKTGQVLVRTSGCENASDFNHQSRLCQEVST